MNILILQGSPNVDGSTAMLCKEFARGASEAGHRALADCGERFVYRASIAGQRLTFLLDMSVLAQ